MKTFFLLFVFAIPAAAQTPNGALADLSWLSGCWETASGKSAATERWGPATSDVLLGTSQTVKDGKTTSYEFLRIVPGGKGPSYIARPSAAKNETEFEFLSSRKFEITFENLQHDFPQRIIYKADGSDQQVARIEGKVNGKLRGTDFRMTRAKC